jgi:hypothetical protein
MNSHRPLASLEHFRAVLCPEYVRFALDFLGDAEDYDRLPAWLVRPETLPDYPARLPSRLLGNRLFHNRAAHETRPTSGIVPQVRSGLVVRRVL